MLYLEKFTLLFFQVLSVTTQSWLFNITAKKNLKTTQDVAQS